MGAATRRAKSRPGERAARNCTNGGLGRQTHTWCPHAQEDLSAGTLWAVLVNVTSQRFSNVRQQGQTFKNPTLSTDEDFARPPLDVAEFERNDFSGA